MLALVSDCSSNLPEIAAEAASNSSRSGGVQKATEIEFSRASLVNRMSVPAGSQIVIKNSESSDIGIRIRWIVSR